MRNILILAAAMTASMSAGTIGLWSTGVCAGLNTVADPTCTLNTALGFGSTDANYTFTDGTSNVPASGTLTTESAISTYVLNGAGASDWDAPGTVGTLYNTGTWTATTTFSLTGFVASSLVLYLDIAADNDVEALLNGNVILNCGSITGSPLAGSTCFSSFTSNHDIFFGGAGLSTSDLNAGTNTLSFIVYNETNPSDTGLRVQVSGTATASAAPEPATFGLVGGALVGLGFIRRRMSRPVA
jgi:hypothetical protein